MPRDFDERVAGVAALEHPLSRRVYRHVAEQREPVARDDVSAHLELPRSVAAFHLEKLVEAGLLETEFRRRTGRAGPGAGRPAKLYRRSPAELTVSIPERHYDLAADVLARALSRAADENLPIDQAVQRAAFDAGRALPPQPGDGAPGSDTTAAAVGLLEEIGYEPRTIEGDIVLDNCPFHALVDEHRELVCTMNLHLLTGVLAGLGVEALAPRLEPEAGQCCVKLGTGRRRVER